MVVTALHEVLQGGTREGWAGAGGSESRRQVAKSQHVLRGGGSTGRGGGLWSVDGTEGTSVDVRAPVVTRVPKVYEGTEQSISG